jgi:peptidoglycan/xylan/chitin deacetylase (PgdA/CDA1 family)
MKFFILLIIVSCASCDILIDDFTRGLNALNLDSSSDNTMTETRTNGLITLKVKSINSYFYSLLGCLNISNPNLKFLRFKFQNLSNNFNFKINVQIANSNCITRNETVTQIINNINNVIYFDLSLLTFEQKNRLLAVDITGFDSDDINKYLYLQRIDLVENVNETIITIIDNFLTFNLKRNSINGIVGDDETCIAQQQTNGLKLIKNTGCYYYTLFKNCYNAKLTTKLRIIYQNVPNLYFNINLQTRDSSCNFKNKSNIISTYNYKPSAINLSNDLMLEIPLIDFNLQGIDFDKLHGFVLTNFNNNIILKQLSLVNNNLDNKITFTIADFESSINRLAFQTNIGTVYSDDSTLNLTHVVNNFNDSYSIKLTPSLYGYLYFILGDCVDISFYDAIKIRFAASSDNDTMRVGFQYKSSCDNNTLLLSSPLSTYLFACSSNLSNFVEAIIPFSYFGLSCLKKVRSIMFDWFDSQNMILIDSISFIKHLTPQNLNIKLNRLNIDSCGVFANDKIIIQTFDDGPILEGNKTSKLLNLLDQLNIKATFFLSPAKYDFQYQPMCDLVQRMINSGHQVAHHSYHHTNFRSLNDTMVFDEINVVEQFFLNCINKTIEYLRPPYGELFARQNNKITSLMNKKIVIWNFDTLDWLLENDTLIFDHVKSAFDDSKKLNNNIDPSSLIILSHDLWTNYSLTEIVPFFKAKGYRYTTIDECYQRCSSQNNCYDFNNPTIYSALSVN